MSDLANIARQKVAIAGHEYPILIGEGVLADAGRLMADELALPCDVQVFIIADETVAVRYMATLGESLAVAGMRAVSTLTVPAGEGSKSFAVYERVVDHLLLNKVKRDSVIVALGGGVIGDLAGFAAATVLRGIRLVQIPTTLLAQVDSSVGGKTGINTAHGKNLIGAFYHPSLVLADVGVMDTLPLREVKAGYAEVLKYALIGNAGFFAWLQEHGWAVLAGDMAARRHAVEVSCAAKAAVVMADPLERHGQRALLNLGHTFGHALEALGGYDGRLLHGEAVAIGMRWAFDYAVRAQLCPAADVRALHAHMDKLELAKVPPFAVTTGEVVAYMMGDKKNTAAGGVTLILPRMIGEAFVARDVAAADIAAFLDTVLQQGG